MDIRKDAITPTRGQMLSGITLNYLLLSGGVYHEFYARLRGSVEISWSSVAMWGRWYSGAGTREWGSLLSAACYRQSTGIPFWFIPNTLVPSASITKISASPYRSLEKAMRLPSGDHAVVIVVGELGDEFAVKWVSENS